MNYSLLCQGTTPPQLDGAIALGDVLAVVLIVGTIVALVIGGLAIVVMIVARRKS
jgi:hypothetical protein